MKHERMTVSLCAVSVLMGSLVSVTCLMCLLQTYGMPCDPGFLIPVCCLTSGVAAAAMCVKKSWMITLGVFTVYLIVMIWQNDLLEEGVSTALYHITYQFEKCFQNVPVMGTQWGDLRLLLAALAIPICWLTVWTICRESYGAFVIVACLPFLCLSLVIVNLAPNLWLVLLTGELLLLILSDSVRTRDAHGGSVLIGWLALPLAVLMIALVILSPIENYERSEWSKMLQSVAEKKIGVERWRKQAGREATVHRTEQKVDLSDVGPREKNGEHTLRYYSEEPVEYLRGMTYSWYENGAWENFAGTVYERYVTQSDLLTCAEQGTEIKIETARVHDVIYTPYVPSKLPEGCEVWYDFSVRNTNGTTQYALIYAPNGSAPAQNSREYEQMVTDLYVLVPEELGEPLYDYLGENDLLSASAREIAEFVRNSGEYELDTPSVPTGEDFVLYFLNESHRGYCVHFASATTLLLKAAGYPARYVTGYAAGGEAGQWNDVSEDDAHAWVEYYEIGTGWQVLDPTPADWHGGTAEPHTEPEEPPERPEEKPEEKPVERPEEPKEPTEKPEQDLSSGQQTADAPAEPTAAPQPGTAGKANKNTTSWYWWLFSLPGVILIVVLRRLFVLRMEQRKRRKAEPNRRALLLWVRLVRLYKAEKVKVPEEILCLAEKAKFSQHTLSEEELAVMETAVKERISHLKKEFVLRRLWHQYGLILY